MSRLVDGLVVDRTASYCAVLVSWSVREGWFTECGAARFPKNGAEWGGAWGAAVRSCCERSATRSAPSHCKAQLLLLVSLCPAATVRQEPVPMHGCLPRATTSVGGFQFADNSGETGVYLSPHLGNQKEPREVVKGRRTRTSIRRFKIAALPLSDPSQRRGFRSRDAGPTEPIGSPRLVSRRRPGARVDFVQR